MVMPTAFRFLVFLSLAGLAIFQPIKFAFADSVKLPSTSVEATDGSKTTASFMFDITSATSVSKLNTQQTLDLKMSLKPDPADIGHKGAIYAIFVKNNTFFLLNADRRFTVWNGEGPTLRPFSEQVVLDAEISVNLLSGKLDSAGEYLVFLAYSLEGQFVLDYTKSPFVLTVHAAQQSPLVDAAFSVFATSLESKVIQTRCVACHVTGGLARNSALQFQRTATGSALNNLSMLQSYLGSAGNSANTLLTKATGGNSHPGGPQIIKDSDDYKAMLQVLTLLEQDQKQRSEGIAYSFNAAQPDAPPGGSSLLLAAVQLEPREATLRRATILFQNRAATVDELAQVRQGDDKTLRAAVRELMSGPQFRDFIVRATNDRLLTEGIEDQPINDHFVNYAVLRNLAYDVQFNEGEQAWIQKYRRRITDASTRASGELIAHVIINERPYSEILTAEYMMMNPLLNQVLGGTAVFPATAGDSDFLPSKITQFYSNNEITVSPKHPIAGTKVLSRGTPMADYPHAGILTDFAFMQRYPTTATNRNRARARWTLYHFLGIDIEKSAQRPTNEAALSDRNNPTLNNPACGVCHAVLDPVAGAFQNWSEHQIYRVNGDDSLDGFYKYPPNGAKSLYQKGDRWYRDMRAPGLFEKPLTNRDYTLRELASRIVEEPGFNTAAALFWWPAIFGSNPVELPAVASDQGFAEKNTAYLAQQSAIDEFATVLKSRRNAKDLLVEMVMSPWFSAQTSTNYAFQVIHLEADLGSEQLLTPDQIAGKTLNLTGVLWRSNEAPDGTPYSYYKTIKVLLGGIDSQGVTERATLLTPSMTSILQTHAIESSCPIVVKDFGLPAAKRRLFTKVSENLTPLSASQTTVEVTSSSPTDWQEHKVTAQIPAKGANIRISFLNPFCDYNGTTCTDQRYLLIDAVTLRHNPSGTTLRLEANAPGTSITGQNCYLNGSNASFFSGCALNIFLNLDDAYELDIIAHMSARQSTTKPERAQAFIEVLSTADIITANTASALLIKSQIVDLFQKLHGSSYALNSKQVQQTYALFSVALIAAQQSGKTQIDNCQTWIDGKFLSDLLTPNQLSLARSPDPKGGNFYATNWDYVNPLLANYTLDLSGAKRAWMAVVTYMLGHYDYIYE